MNMGQPKPHRGLAQVKVPFGQVVWSDAKFAEPGYTIEETSVRAIYSNLNSVSDTE